MSGNTGWLTVAWYQRKKEHLKQLLSPPKPMIAKLWPPKTKLWVIWGVERGVQNG